MCPRVGEEPDDRILEGYSSCALIFTQREFEYSTGFDELTGFKQIKLYVNHPSAILSWIETCSNRVEDERVCETEVL